MVRENGFAQLISVVLATIVLGAIGSGLWEVVLSPLFDWFSEIFLNTFASMFSGYLDHLYEPVSREPGFSLLAFPALLLVVMIITAPWFAIYSIFRLANRIRGSIESPDRNEDEDLDEEAILKRVATLRRRTIIFLIPLIAASSIAYGEALFHTTHSWKAKIFIERSIEIISPHISAAEILRLRAEFRSIDSAEKFYKLEDTLRSIAKKNEISLPEFESIR